MNPLEWREVKEITSRSYTCGHCGNPVASEKGWLAFLRGAGGNAIASVHICHQCTRPTFFDHDKRQYPGVAFASPVKDIPDPDVNSLYEEARSATSVGANTAAVLSCRKLLMHIAVAKGALANQDFLSYVKFLADNHFIPPDASPWVDQIRTKGNEANHQIKIMSKDDAEDLVSFVEMLLKVIFEFPARTKKPASPASGSG